MAQIPGVDTSMLQRVRALIRQRPAIAVGIVMVVVLLVGAGVCGVVQAAGTGGFEIERTGTGAKADRGDGVDGEAEGNRGRGGSSEADGIDEVGGADEAEARIVVDVSGAVVRPAVVELAEGDRVQDAIEAAGGLAADADVSGVNRAAKLTDGQRVYVPRVGEAVSADADGAGAATGADAGGDVGSSPGLVNINTASAAELDELPGVGPSTAQAIIEDREANGPFSTIEDVMRVSGIGEKKFEKLKSSICV